MTDKAVTKPDREKILILYAAFGASLISGVIPTMSAAALSLILILGVMIAAYVMQAGADEESLLDNHSTFVIRTIWIGGFLAAITMIAAAIYLLKFGNIYESPLFPCMQKLLDAPPEMMMDAMKGNEAMFERCVWSFVSLNLRSFIIGGLIAAGPVLLYFAARFARGFTRALRGDPVGNVKGWV